MNRIPPALLRQFLFLLLIFGLGVLLFLPMRDLVPALLGAYTLYVVLRRPKEWLMVRWRWPRIAAIIVLMTGSFLLLALPVLSLIQLVQQRVVTAWQQHPTLVSDLETQIHLLEQQLNLTLLTPANLEWFRGWFLGMTTQVVNTTLMGLGLLVLSYLLLFFMLWESETLERAFFNWLPLRQENVAYLHDQLNSLVLSNAVGIPLLGILQGFAGLPAYALAGLDDVWLWFAITCISGMLPVVGVALAYVPITLITAASGEPVKALSLLLYGFFVIGSADNLARMWLQKKIGNIHPVITFFGVIAGLRLFGFIGFVFGPVLLSLLLLLLRLYVKEFGKGPHAAEETAIIQ